MQLPSQNEVHLWRLNLKSKHCPEYFTVLSSEDKKKARQIKKQKLQTQFIVSKAALRIILAKYVLIEPREIALENPKNKKPFWCSSQNHNTIEFNLTHSHEIGLLAIAQKTAVGVDLEYMRDIPNCALLAKRFFSQAEYQFLTNCSVQNQKQVFFKLWTAKEAFLKAQGLGIAGNLNQFSVQLDRGKKQLSIDKQGLDKNSWQIREIETEKNYAGALAVQSKQKVLIKYLTL